MSELYRYRSEHSGDRQVPRQHIWGAGNWRVGSELMRRGVLGIAVKSPVVGQLAALSKRFAR
jgi:hypothetical protein